MNTALHHEDWPTMDGFSDILNEIQSMNYPASQPARDEDPETSSPASSETTSMTTAFPFPETDLSGYSSLPSSLQKQPFFQQDEMNFLQMSDYPYDPEREVYDELTGPRDNSSMYSRKVFIGGLPKTLTAKELCHFFSEFGPVMIDWPHRERMPDRPPHGYAFAVFSRSSSVDSLVNRCSVSRGKHCIYLGPYCVQVRPWIKMDREYYATGYDYVSSTRTQRYSIFIGGVARTSTARGLAETIESAIGDVVAVRIEVDYDTEYPKGAARVIFGTEKAYITAIARRFISMASHDLHKDEYKEVEMKPYLEDCMICERCFKMSTRSFCAELRCLKYFCDPCWKIWHSSSSIHSSDHRPMLKGLNQTSSSYRSSHHPNYHYNRTSAPSSPFLPPISLSSTGSSHHHSSSAMSPSFWTGGSSGAGVPRGGAGGSMRHHSSSASYGTYPSLLTTPSSVLMANGSLNGGAGSVGRRSGLATIRGSTSTLYSEIGGPFGRDAHHRRASPPPPFGRESAASMAHGGGGGNKSNGLGIPSACSTTNSHFTFDDVSSLSPSADSMSPLSPMNEKTRPSKFFGY